MLRQDESWLVSPQWANHNIMGLNYSKREEKHLEGTLEGITYMGVNFTTSSFL